MIFNIEPQASTQNVSDANMESSDNQNDEREENVSSSPQSRNSVRDSTFSIDQPVRNSSKTVDETTLQGSSSPLTSSGTLISDHAELGLSSQNSIAGEKSATLQKENKVGKCDTNKNEEITRGSEIEETHSHSSSHDAVAHEEQDGHSNCHTSPDASSRSVESPSKI